jgi:hypothetical protein
LTALRLAPAVLSLLVLAAHFLRAGSVALVGVSLALAALLAVRRPWAARTVQAALIVGAAAVLTGLSALVFRAPRVRGWFRLT